MPCEGSSQKDGERFDAETAGPDETESLGRQLAGLLPRGCVVALYGELAAGKTCFVRGMAHHFTRDEVVHSPTFTLVNEYGIDPKLYHVDLYRLEGSVDLAMLGYEELFDSDAGICVVEWADRAAEVLPARRVDVYLDYGYAPDVRNIAVVNHGCDLPHDWTAALQ